MNSIQKANGILVLNWREYIVFEFQFYTLLKMMSNSSDPALESGISE